MKRGPNPRENGTGTGSPVVVAVAAAEDCVRRALGAVVAGLGDWDCVLLPREISASARQALTDLDGAKARLSALLTTLPGAPGAAGVTPFGVRFLRGLLEERPPFAVIVLALRPVEELRARWSSQVLERAFLVDRGVQLLDPPHRLVDLLGLVGGGLPPLGRATEEE